jgi:hypothetical protein
MRLTTAIAAAIGLLSAGLAGQVSAEPKLYAYPSSANYCPAGLQPVTLGGAIGCGTPNQPMTYAEVKAHPVVHRHPHRHRTAALRRSARVPCPVGAKGCSYQ